MLELCTKPRFNNQGELFHLECTDETALNWLQQVLQALVLTAGRKSLLWTLSCAGQNMLDVGYLTLPRKAGVTTGMLGERNPDIFIQWFQSKSRHTGYSKGSRTNTWRFEEKCIFISVQKVWLSTLRKLQGLPLLHTCYKVLTNMIEQSLKKYTDNIIGEYQNSFRCVISTTVRCVGENYIDVHQLLVDFCQAYDSVNRNALHRIMIDVKIRSYSG